MYVNTYIHSYVVRTRFKWREQRLTCMSCTPISHAVVYKHAKSKNAQEKLRMYEIHPCYSHTCLKFKPLSWNTYTVRTYIVKIYFLFMHVRMYVRSIILMYIITDIDKLEDVNVIEAFRYLIFKLKTLFREENFSKLKSICQLRGAPLPLEFKQQVKAAREVHKIFDVLRDNPLYCNWLNVRLLKRIAKNINNQRAVKLMQTYENSMYSKKVSEVKQYVSRAYFDAKTVSVLEVQINKNHEDLTVKQVIDISKELDTFYRYNINNR